MGPIFKTTMLVYQSMANLDFVWYNQSSYRTRNKESARKGLYGNQDSTFRFGP